MQKTISQWKKYGEAQSCRVKILNTCDRQLVKTNRRKNIQQLTSMFNEDPKKISARTMCRELKEMGITSCVSTRKRVRQTFWPGSVYISIIDTIIWLFVIF